MRRVWAALVAVWATLAIVALLAWAHPPAKTYATQGTPAVVVLQGKNGSKHTARVVLLPAGTPGQVTTGSSQVASSGGSAQLTAGGAVTVLPSSTQPVAATGPS